MSDELRVLVAVTCFVLGTVLTLAVSVVAGMVLMVVGLAALLWGRSLGDRGRR